MFLVLDIITFMTIVSARFLKRFPGTGAQYGGTRPTAATEELPHALPAGGALGETTDPPPLNPLTPVQDLRPMSAANEFTDVETYLAAI